MKFLPFLLTVITLFGCQKAPVPKEVDNEEPVFNVEAYQCKLEEVTPQIDSFGTLSFKNKIDISPSSEGIIRHIYDKEGSKVSRGQVVARIENLQLEIEKRKAVNEVAIAQISVNQAETKLEEAYRSIEARLLSQEKSKLELNIKKQELQELDREIERKSQLLKVDGISQEEFRKLQISRERTLSRISIMEKDIEINQIGFRNEDIITSGYSIPDDESERIEILQLINTKTEQANLAAAQTRLEAAQSNLESINLLLSDLIVRAPKTGIIGAIHKNEGERQKSGDKIITIILSSEVYAVFPIQESESQLIENGQQATITVPTLSNQFEGVIDVVSPMLDPKTGNLTVKALIKNEGTLLPGMFFNITIEYDNPKNAIFVPTTSIVMKKGDNANIFVINNRRSLLKGVTVGTEKDNRTEILDGLSDGDIIINNPPSTLKEGSLVKYDKK